MKSAEEKNALTKVCCEAIEQWMKGLGITEKSKVYMHVVRNAEQVIVGVIHRKSTQEQVDEIYKNAKITMGMGVNLEELKNITPALETYLGFTNKEPNQKLDAFEKGLIAEAICIGLECLYKKREQNPSVMVVSRFVASGPGDHRSR